MKYKGIIFDLDGTLIDTAPGIISCYKCSLEVLGIPAEPVNIIKEYIGSSPKKIFMERYNLDESEVDGALRIYRDFYRENGIYNAKPYKDITNILKIISKSGMKISVATLKLDKFAKEVLYYFRLQRYINYIFGVDEGDTLEKSDLIAKCIYEMKLKKNEVVMVGDSKNDLYGAKKQNIDFIAANYGYGSFNKFLECENINIVNKPIELLNILDLNMRVLDDEE